MSQAVSRFNQLSAHIAPEMPCQVLPNPSSSKPAADIVFEDEDDSKYVYVDLPEDKKVPRRFTAKDLLANGRIFTLADGSKVEIRFRRFIEGEDDEAFRKLDAQCVQGAAGMASYYFLKEKWSSFQKYYDCIVAHPANDPKEIIASARCHRKWVYLNNQRVPLSYHSLLRVAPLYRSCRLGEFTEKVLLLADYDQGDRYYLSYIVEDNAKSIALQHRMVEGQNEESRLQEFKRWFITGYTPSDLALQLEGFPTPDESIYEVYHSTSIIEQVVHVKSHFGKAHLLPCDVSNIFRSKLSEGTYFVRNKATSEPIASVSVWNSGAVRTSRLPGMKDYLDRPCTFYNPWTNDSVPKEKVNGALEFLIRSVAQKIISSNTHGWIYLASLEDHPLSQFLPKKAKYFIAFKARLWYWDSTIKHDPSTGCDIAFDPRDSMQ